VLYYHRITNLLITLAVTLNEHELNYSAILYLNKSRNEFEIYTRYRQALLVKTKTTNPYGKTGEITQIYDKYYKEKNRGGKITHYKSKYICIVFAQVQSLEVNPIHILHIKTSTWLKTDTNEILIISHIPKEISKTPIFSRFPYPDSDQNINRK